MGYAADRFCGDRIFDVSSSQDGRVRHLIAGNENGMDCQNYRRHLGRGFFLRHANRSWDVGRDAISPRPNTFLKKAPASFRSQTAGRVIENWRKVIKKVVLDFYDPGQHVYATQQAREVRPQPTIH